MSFSNTLPGGRVLVFGSKLRYNGIGKNMRLDKKFWEKYFKVYDVLNIAIPYQELMNKLERELNLNPDDVILDVGSGTGNLMMLIKDKCKNVIGLDYSEAGIRIHKSKDLKAQTILHDITEKFPFSDNYFSKIVSNNTIYTLTKEQQRRTLLEMYRVLKPGGKVVISNVKRNYSPFKIYFSHVTKSIKKQGFQRTFIVITKLIIPTIKMFYYNNKIKESGLKKHYNFLNPDEQKEILKDAGFKNISETSYVFANQAFFNAAYK